jgi:thioredoxin-related protein
LLERLLHYLLDFIRDGQTVPETMQAYKLRGTPSLVLIDKRGMVREILFGQVDELALGVALGKLMAE